MIRSGRVYDNLMVDVRATNLKLRDRAARIVSTLTDLEREPALALLESKQMGMSKPHWLCTIGRCQLRRRRHGWGHTPNV